MTAKDPSSNVVDLEGSPSRDHQETQDDIDTTGMSAEERRAARGKSVVKPSRDTSKDRSFLDENVRTKARDAVVNELYLMDNEIRNITFFVDSLRTRVGAMLNHMIIQQQPHATADIVDQLLLNQALTPIRGDKDGQGGQDGASEAKKRKETD